MNKSQIIKNMHTVNHEMFIVDQDSKLIVSKLYELLANEFIIYLKTRNAHWNVEGPDFYSMHTLFEAQYRRLDEVIDEVAERIRTIGHYAPATLKSYQQLGTLQERMNENYNSTHLLQELLSDHVAVIAQLKEDVLYTSEELNDPATTDFLTGLIEIHEKIAWMLRAHCKK